MHACPENWFFLSDAGWHLEDSPHHDWEDKYPRLTKANCASRVIYLMNVDPQLAHLSLHLYWSSSPLGPFRFISHVAATATEIWSCYPPITISSITPLCFLKTKTQSFRLTGLLPTSWMLPLLSIFQTPWLFSFSALLHCSSSHRTLAPTLSSGISLYPSQHTPFISQLSYFPREAIPLQHAFARHHVHAPAAPISV